LIHQRASLLKRAKRPNQLWRHGVASNIEMQQRALRLRSPINIRGDFDLSHAVGFNAGTRNGFSKSSHNGISYQELNIIRRVAASTELRRVGGASYREAKNGGGPR